MARTTDYINDPEFMKPCTLLGYVVVSGGVATVSDLFDFVGGHRR